MRAAPHALLARLSCPPVSPACPEFILSSVRLSASIHPAGSLSSHAMGGDKKVRRTQMALEPGATVRAGAKGYRIVALAPPVRSGAKYCFIFTCTALAGRTPRQVAPA